MFRISSIRLIDIDHSIDILNHKVEIEICHNYINIYIDGKLTYVYNGRYFIGIKD